MKIMTITRRLDNSQEFDNAVNEAIKQGWQLKKRKVLLPVSQPSGSTFIYIMLYAELEK